MSVFSRSSNSNSVKVELAADEPQVSDYVDLDESDVDAGDWVDEFEGECVEWLYGEWEVVCVNEMMVEIAYVDDGRFPDPQPIKRFERDAFATGLMESEYNRQP